MTAEADALPGQAAFALLPTVPGKVHGIVQVEPFVRIQCDGCGFVHDGKPGKLGLAVLTCGIEFNPRAHERGDRRRLCSDCRKAEPDDTWRSFD